MLPIAQPRYFRGHSCSQSPLWYSPPTKPLIWTGCPTWPKYEIRHLSHARDNVGKRMTCTHGPTCQIVQWYSSLSKSLATLVFCTRMGQGIHHSSYFLLVTCMLASYHETFYLCARGSTLKLFWEFLIIVVLKPFSYSWTFCWQVCFVIFVGSRPSSRTSSAWDFPKQNSGQSYGSLYVCALGKSSLFSEWKDN
jgi:hypothetical protein